MKPIDRLGFGPTRVVCEDGEGGYIVMVTPPKLLGPKPTMHVPLTADQYRRYNSWLFAGVLMQDALPDLDAATREMLLTGLSNEDFHKFAKDDE